MVGARTFFIVHYEAILSNRPHKHDVCKQYWAVFSAELLVQRGLGSHAGAVETASHFPTLPRLGSPGAGRTGN